MQTLCNFFSLKVSVSQVGRVNKICHPGRGCGQMKRRNLVFTDFADRGDVSATSATEGELTATGATEEKLTATGATEEKLTATGATEEKLTAIGENNWRKPF